MNYVYYRIPPNMKGDILYPLNELKNTYPEIFEKEAEKYEGRAERILACGRFGEPASLLSLSPCCTIKKLFSNGAQKNGQ
jgi:hypothetical protein